MTLHTFPDIEQGTPEWLELRRGVLTASTIGQLISPRAVKPASNQASRALTLTLAAERLSGHIDPVYVSDDMMRGQMEEPLARDLYAETTGAEVTETGFMTEDRWGFALGYSPDGVIGKHGLLEIKSRRQKKHLQTIVEGTPPIENMAQLQCGLLVSGRDWIDYVSYCGGMPLWWHRVLPDPAWQTAILQAAADFEKAVNAITGTYRARAKNAPIPPRSDIDTEIEI